MYCSANKPHLASSSCFSLAFLLAFLPWVFARRALASDNISSSESYKETKRRQQWKMQSLWQCTCIRLYNCTILKWYHLHTDMNLILIAFVQYYLKEIENIFCSNRNTSGSFEITWNVERTWAAGKGFYSFNLPSCKQASLLRGHLFLISQGCLLTQGLTMHVRVLRIYSNQYERWIRIDNIVFTIFIHVNGIRSCWLCLRVRVNFSRSQFPWIVTLIFFSFFSLGLISGKDDN